MLGRNHEKMFICKVELSSSVTALPLEASSADFDARDYRSIAAILLGSESEACDQVDPLAVG